MQDSTSSIFTSAKRFFSGTMLSRITGLLRDIAMASAFGAHEAIAAFLVAFRLSHLLRRLLGEGALQTAFIPQFEKLRGSDPRRASAFFQSLCTVLAGILCLVVVAAMLILSSVLFLIDLSPGNQEIIWLTLLMMPSLIFICLYGLNGSLLQCEKIYFIPGAAPCLFNAIWIAGVLFLKDSDPRQAMPWLSAFIIVACAGQWAITLPSTRKILKQNRGRSTGKSPNLRSSDLIGIVKPLMLGILGVSAMQVNTALDAIFARWADPAGPALLWYAIRLQQLPLALFGVALSGALLPPLTRALKENDTTRYLGFLEFSLRRSMEFMLPITCGIFAMGSTAILLLYGHGDFSSHAVLATTQCLWGYGIGLIPMTWVLILSPAFYAQENYKIPTMASIGSMGLNVLLNAVFIGVFDLGAASIAWATSLSACVNASVLYYVLRQGKGSLVSTDFWISFCKIGSASLLGTAALFAFDLSQAYSQKNSFLTDAGELPRVFADQVYLFLGESLAFGTVFLAAAWLFGVFNEFTNRTSRAYGDSS